MSVVLTQNKISMQAVY